MNRFAEVCECAAKAGGQILLDWLGRIQAREKAPRDLVTEADLASQRAIQEIVQDAFPEHQFLGEEEDDDTYGRPDEGPPCWIVDPLDGTTNFVHQLPNFSVSVAVAQGNQPMAGCVYDPMMGECFLATRGGGATLNGQPLHTSNCEQLSDALVAFSFSANVARDSEEVARFLNVLGRCQALRRMGSAALNMCYLSAGRLDGYWATSVKAWDVAAGVLLVEEAGGLVSDIDGGQLDLTHPRFVAASTPVLHRELMDRLDIAVGGSGKGAEG